MLLGIVHDFHKRQIPLGFCQLSVLFTFSYEGWWWSRRHKCLLSGIYYWAVLSGASFYSSLTDQEPWSAPAPRFFHQKYEKGSCTLLSETDSADTCENIHSPKKAEHMKNCTTGARNNLKKFPVTDYSCFFFFSPPTLQLAAEVYPYFKQITNIVKIIQLEENTF